jgi:hypothetical protein
MPTSAYNKFNVVAQDILNGVHNFGSHTFKALLTNTAPVATNTVKANLTEITTGNSYAAGGPTVPMAVSLATATAKVTATDVTITASGGSIGPFRYVSLYNDTQTSPAKPLVCWLDYGTNLTLLDGESILIDFDGTNGLFTQV